MFEWLTPEADCSPPAAPAPGGAVFHFAAEHADGELQLPLDLLTGTAAAPDLALEPPAGGATLTCAGPCGEGAHRYLLTVPAAVPEGDPLADDELTFTVRGLEGVPPARVVLRRTAWRLDTALLERQRQGPALWPQTRAALLWYGWGRYRALVGLKRFTSGLSGSDVLVFQPMLRRPADTPDGPQLPAAGPQAWGSFLLAKTGPLEKVAREWKGFRDFLADRAHPFMGRCEACLTAQPAGPPGPGGRQATLVGSFLGGDLLQVEPLESVVRGPESEERCLHVLEKLLALLAPWYAGAELDTLARWGGVFARGGGRGVLLFGRYDWSRPDGAGGVHGRDAYAEPLSWDTAFIKEDHLSGHLLGRGPGRPGLLHRLRDEVRVRYSITHGDLHPRNVLADRDNVWLLDFGEAGADAPTLHDFAKLEVFLRLWCLDLSPAARAPDDGAAKFEKGLLDALLGTAGGLGDADELAAMLGARPEVLRKVAACVTWLRRRAAPYGAGAPGRQDYLAVLFLTVLQTLQYAGQERGRLANYRLLVTLACLLEDVLSRQLGLAPFPRGRESLDHRRLITPAWLAAPGAPARVAYLMRRRDGRRALPFLAATRGVLQNPFHHLDVFDHTLLVMANLEELLRDPLRALRDPAAYERRVAKSLRRQRLPLTATRSRPVETKPPNVDDLGPHLDEVRRMLDGCLDGRSRLLLKWLCLLHDVGKPATRGLHTDGGAPRVQFRGHESYSAFVVEEHLRHWFPEDGERARLSALIRNHHLHHQLMDKYLGRPALGELRQALLRGEARGELLQVYRRLDPEPGDGYVPDFPLLVLHGFADVAGCAGPESSGLGPVAEMGLLLLAACARFPRFRRERRVRQQVGRALHDFQVPVGKEYGRLVREVVAWADEHCPEASCPGADGPSEEAVRAEVGRLLARPPRGE